MAKQIPPGSELSGLPYWTMDTGGYTMQRQYSHEPMTAANEEEWRELNARWFELSTFTPILRVHGELRAREMWTLGDGSQAYNTMKFDRLRYALFPYIYSQVGWTTQHNYTMMRPLVMDFPFDRTARELNDEYMFGFTPRANMGAREGPVSLLWLEAFGVAAVEVTGPDGREFYKPFWNTRKFDGLLPVLWRSGGDVIYRFPSAHLRWPTPCANRRFFFFFSSSDRIAGPEACTESGEIIRVASRGGIWFITRAAPAVSTRSFSFSGRPSICSRTAATICGTPGVERAVEHPAQHLDVGHPGVALRTTPGARCRPTARPVSCWPGTTTSYRPTSAGHST